MWETMGKMDLNGKSKFGIQYAFHAFRSFVSELQQQQQKKKNLSFGFVMKIH